VVLDAGKPVLVVPYIGHFEHVGRKTWSRGMRREAALAVFESLPVLQRADSVDVVFRAPQRGAAARRFEREAMSRYWAAMASRQASERMSRPTATSATHLSRAADAGADAIVMAPMDTRRCASACWARHPHVLESMTVL